MLTPSTAPRFSDSLRAIPAPAALVLIAGASFFGVPMIAGLFGGGGTASAEAKPSNDTAHPDHAEAVASGLPPSIPASMPTYMPSLTGSASPATYAAPAAVASTGYVAGVSDGTDSSGGGGNGSGGGGGSSKARQHQPKAADQVQATPTGREHPHPGPRGAYDPRGARQATAATTRPVYHHDLPPTIRPVMPQRVAATMPVAPAQPRFAFARPVAPMRFFGGGGMRGGGGFRSFGGGGRHR